MHKLLIYIMLYCMSKISKNGLKKALEICVKIQKSLFLNISQSVNYVFSLLKAIMPHNLTSSISETNNNSCTKAIMADPPLG